MTSVDNKAQAEQLKVEGNAFHSKGDFAAARSKYTSAIKLDGGNAVLYANRAAAYIALRQYLDAAKDARKATELDPKYGKAWARLGKSSYELHLFEQSISAWKNALDSLPTADLSPQETQLKAQYEEGMRLAEAGLETSKTATGNFRTLPSDAKPPWIVALEMEDVLTANNVLNSCAWPLMNAYKDFSEGVRCMKQIKKSPGGIQGNLNALQALVGGLLRDQRVFHMDAGWSELQLQVEFELAAFGGWAEGGPETIKEEAVKLLKEKGWKEMRLALAATIRAWFLRAYFAHKSGASLDLAMQYYGHIVDVLEWGAHLWHDVPASDRGHIFEKTYVRAMRHFRMNAYLSGLRDSEGDSAFNEETLLDMAHQMIQETMANTPQEQDGSFSMDKGAWYSFFVYPVAEANATIGAVLLQRGLGAKEDGDAEEADKLLAAAAKAYKDAAEMYPPDDELYPYFLKMAFEAMWYRGRPLSETLSVCERIGKSLPAVAKIWESGPSVNLKENVHQLDRWMTRAYTGLLEEKYTMETLSSEVPLN